MTSRSPMTGSTVGRSWLRRMAVLVVASTALAAGALGIGQAADAATTTQYRTCTEWEGGFVWYNVEGQVHVNPNGTVASVDKFDSYISGVTVGVELKSSSAYYNLSNGGHTVTITGRGTLFVGADVPGSGGGIGYSIPVTCQASFNF